MAIRLISLLRTQLKSDLAIYGATYSGKLNSYERFFLIQSGVDLRSKAWAEAAGIDPRWRWLRRRPKIADKFPTEPPSDVLQPSPLRGMRSILDVGEIPRTPLSSRMAMRKALGGSVGSAEADSNIPNGIPGRGEVEHRPGGGP